jgi:hypothetical protein
MQMSKLQQWVERNAPGDEPYPPDTSDPRKVTLRISAYDYFRLEKLSGVSGMSRTRTAEELLAAAIADAYEQLGLHEEPEEFMTWLAA